MAKIQKKFSNNLVIGLIAFAVIALGSVGLVVAYSGGYIFAGDCVNCTVEGSSAQFGAAPSGDFTGFTDIYVEDELNVDGTATFAGAASITGTATLGTVAADSIGINATNTATTVLDMLGTMRTYPAGVATTTCDTGSAGAIMYSTGTAKLLGCDGANWNALW